MVAEAVEQVTRLALLAAARVFGPLRRKVRIVRVTGSDDPLPALQEPLLA